MLRSRKLVPFLLSLLLVTLVPTMAWCAGGLHDMSVALGPQLPVYWVIPFVCMLLSIAIGPLALPHFWHHHFGKVALFWGLAFL
ncbi:sodium:proton antiporter, partial [Desulfovibrio sp. OttesenSCG-928-M16]|nr:sodium:proton antiporter [Desulfovibrio sp. OttesenSCG-928-M16]